MTTSNIESIIATTIDKYEGGFVNHRNDRGGPTNMGITKRVYEQFKGRSVSVQEIRDMPRYDAVEIYKKQYFLDPGIDRLPSEVHHKVFDMSVNHGPRRAVTLLQRALVRLGWRSTSRDGVIGPQTIGNTQQALNTFGKNRVVNTMVEVRNEFFDAIIRNDRSQRVFERGWKNRSNSFLS